MRYGSLSLIVKRPSHDLAKNVHLDVIVDEPSVEVDADYKVRTNYSHWST